MSRLKAARATERMREMVSENGPCSELTACLVPLPLKPQVLLEGLLPQVRHQTSPPPSPSPLSHPSSPGTSTQFGGRWYCCVL